MELSLVHLTSLLVFVPSKEKLGTKASDKRVHLSVQGQRGKRWSKGVKGNYHIKIAIKNDHERGDQEARVSADL